MGALRFPLDEFKILPNSWIPTVIADWPHFQPKCHILSQEIDSLDFWQFLKMPGNGVHFRERIHEMHYI